MARVADDMVLLANEDPTSREGATQPPVIIIEAVSMLSSLEAGIATGPEGADAPPAGPLAMTETQVPNSASAKPSTSSMPPPRVLRATAMVLPNAVVTLDTGLEEKMLGFILQPQDYHERSSWMLRELSPGSSPNCSW